VIEGLSALIVSTGQFPQYDGPEDLAELYDLFRSSLLPGGRLYRAAERELNSDAPASSFVDNAHLLANLLNEWRTDSHLGVNNHTEMESTNESHMTHD
jgi:hypothetical protein